MSLEIRKFDKEYKLRMVALSKTREVLNELAKEVGIQIGLIYRWRSEFLDKGAGSFQGQGNPQHTPEEALIAKLKKQIRNAEMERDINTMRTHVCRSKKAIRIFSKGDGKSTGL